MFYALIIIAFCLLLMIMLTFFLVLGGPDYIALKIAGEMTEHRGMYTIVDKKHIKSILFNDFIITLEGEDGKCYMVYVNSSEYANCNKEGIVYCKFNGYENLQFCDNFEKEPMEEAGGKNG